MGAAITGGRSTSSPFAPRDIGVAVVVALFTSVVGGILCYHGFYSTDRAIDALVRGNHRYRAIVQTCAGDKDGGRCYVDVYPGDAAPAITNTTLRDDNLADGATVTVLGSTDLSQQIALASDPYGDSRASGYRTYGVFCLIADAIALGVLVTAAVFRVRRRRAAA